MRSLNWFKILVAAAIAVVSLALPYLVSTYYLHLAIISLIYILLASSLNMIVGYTGQLSLGHAAFYGVGAYTSALLTLELGWSFWVAAPAAALLASAFGVLLGIPALRLKGPYLVISTLSFGEIVRHTFLNWTGLTRGPMGLTGIPAPTPVSVFGLGPLSFDTKISYYYLLLPIVAVTLLIIRNLVNSKTGRALRAIREDSIAAEIMGINLTFYKIFAFSFGALLAGLAGSLYVHYIRFVSPETFTVSESINFLVMIVIGGMGTILGPIIGAVGITYLLETMRILADYRLIIYGTILFLAIVFMPEGLAGLFGTRVLRRLRRGVDVPS